MNIKDIQKTMAEFMKQQEKQELMNEQINDIMADDDMDVSDDTEVDKIIDEIASGDKQKTVLYLTYFHAFIILQNRLLLV